MHIYNTRRHHHHHHHRHERHTGTRQHPTPEPNTSRKKDYYYHNVSLSQIDIHIYYARVFCSACDSAPTDTNKMETNENLGCKIKTTVAFSQRANNFEIYRLVEKIAMTLWSNKCIVLGLALWERERENGMALKWPSWEVFFSRWEVSVRQLWLLISQQCYLNPVPSSSQSIFVKLAKAYRNFWANPKAFRIQWLDTQLGQSFSTKRIHFKSRIIINPLSARSSTQIRS